MDDVGQSAIITNISGPLSIESSIVIKLDSLNYKFSCQGKYSYPDSGPNSSNFNFNISPHFIESVEGSQSDHSCLIKAISFNSF